MKSDKLVVNASPIISLAKIGCADFLTVLFDQLVIPEGVFEEITAHAEPLLLALRSNGFRVSDNIITAALQIVGEDNHS